MDVCIECQLPIDPEDALLVHDARCPGDGIDCACSATVHYYCLGGASDRAPAVVVEHMLEITHPDPVVALWATLHGAWAMVRACPLVESLTAVSRYDALVTLRPGVRVADAQSWLRGHRAIGVAISQAWIRDCGDDPPPLPEVPWVGL